MFTIVAEMMTKKKKKKKKNRKNPQQNKTKQKTNKQQQQQQQTPQTNQATTNKQINKKQQQNKKTKPKKPNAHWYTSYKPHNIALPLTGNGADVAAYSLATGTWRRRHNRSTAWWLAPGEDATTGLQPNDWHPEKTLQQAYSL